MFLRHCLLIIILAFALTAQSQDYIVRTRQDSVNALLNAIKLDNSVASPPFKTLRPLRQYHCFWLLDKISTDEELLKYATGSNACLKVYGLAALEYRSSKYFKTAQETMYSDTGRVMLAKGDFFSTATVAKFIKTKSFVNLALNRDTSYMTKSLQFNEYRDAYFRILVGWPDDILKTRQDSIKILITTFRKRNLFESSRTGIAGSPSDQYYTFKFLEAMSTDAELFALTKDSLPSLRVYSYIVLAHRKYERIRNVRDDLLLDTSKLSVTSGCVTYRTTVSQLMQIKDVESYFIDNENDNFWCQLVIDPAYRALYFKELGGMEN